MTKLATTLPRTAAVLAEGRRHLQHLGAQIHVAWRGRTVVSAGVGERRAGEAMDAATLSLWLSAGKPLTAVAVARQWEAGRLDLDEPVAGRLPEFGAGGKEGVTVGHLLTHTGGFRGADTLPEEMPWEERIAAICGTPLESGWVPGETAGYQTHGGWYILAELVARLEGRPFAEHLRAKILEPLGLGDTWVGMSATAYREYGARIGTTHVTFPREPSPHPTWDGEAACTRCRPGGNARGPVRELGRFYEALLAGGRGVVRPETVREFTRRRREGRYDATFRHVVDFGLGFLVNSNRYGVETVPYGYGRHASAETYGHSGAQSGCAFADPERELVVAWVCNGLPGEVRHQRRQRAINTAIYEDLGLV